MSEEHYKEILMAVSKKYRHELTLDAYHDALVKLLERKQELTFAAVVRSTGTRLRAMRRSEQRRMARERRRFEIMNMDNAPFIERVN